MFGFSKDGAGPPDVGRCFICPYPFTLTTIPVVAELEALLGPVSVLELALVAATLLIAGFLRGFVGFGGALIVIMVVSAVFGPLIAVPIAVLTGLPSTIQLLPVAVRHAERPFVIPFGLASFAAAPFGTWVLVSVEPAVMKMAISVAVLGMVLMLYRGWRFGSDSLLVLLGAGTAAGLIQGSAGIGGPPVVAVVLSRPGTPEQQRANVIGAVTALALCSLPALWYHALFTRDVLLLGLVLFPLYASTTWLGSRYFSAGGKHHFRNAALALLAAVGVITLGLAIRDYLTG